MRSTKGFCKEKLISSESMEQNLPLEASVSQKNSHHFMKKENSLTCLQEPVTFLYSEPD
jgi:hypothetical protein